MSFNDDEEKQSVLQELPKQTEPNSNCLSLDDIFSSASEATRRALSCVLEDEMIKAYGKEIWTEIIVRKPPWSFYDVFICIKKHWLAVFKLARFDITLYHLVEDMLDKHTTLMQNSADFTSDSVQSFITGCLQLVKGLGKKCAEVEVRDTSISSLEGLDELIRCMSAAIYLHSNQTYYSNSTSARMLLANNNRASNLGLYVKPLRFHLASYCCIILSKNFLNDVASKNSFAHFPLYGHCLQLLQNAKSLVSSSFCRTDLAGSLAAGDHNLAVGQASCSNDDDDVDFEDLDSVDLQLSDDEQAAILWLTLDKVSIRGIMSCVHDDLGKENEFTSLSLQQFGGLSLGFRFYLSILNKFAFNKSLKKVLRRVFRVNILFTQSLPIYHVGAMVWTAIIEHTALIFTSLNYTSVLMLNQAPLELQKLLTEPVTAPVPSPALCIRVMPLLNELIASFLSGLETFLSSYDLVTTTPQLSLCYDLKQALWTITKAFNTDCQIENVTPSIVQRSCLSHESRQRLWVGYKNLHNVAELLQQCLNQLPS